MKPRIDLQKSIERQRLIYRYTTSLFLARLVDNFRWMVLLTLPTLVFFNKHIQPSILGISILATYMIVFLISLYMINSAVVIKGANLTENRKRIIELIQKKFPDTVINSSGQTVIHCKRKVGLFSWGREITVIFDDANLLVNMSTLGRLDHKSPFHSIINYIKMRNLRKEF